MKGRSNDGADNTINGIMAVCVLVLLGALGFLLFVPAPSVAKAQKDHTLAQSKISAAAIAAGTKAKETEAMNAPSLWDMSLQSVGPNALAKVTALAKSHQVKLISFRPQRTGEVDGLTAVPFLMTIDGTYPNVVAFVREIESTQSKLAVSQAQMTSSDGSSDKVSASIGVVAYMKSTGETTNG